MDTNIESQKIGSDAPYPFSFFKKYGFWFVVMFLVCFNFGFGYYLYFNYASEDSYDIAIQSLEGVEPLEDFSYSYEVLNYSVAVANGKEKKVYSKKISNTTGVLITTDNVVSCDWNSPDSPNKHCVSDMIIENTNRVKPTIAVPQLDVLFSKNNFENLKYFYSDEFDVVTREVIKVSEENYSIIEKFDERVFKNFKVMPSTIDTSKIFAVRLEFDVPKYSSSSFNFSLGNFARIDPAISTCGNLNSIDPYILSADIVTNQQCFVIEANNVSLDCRGRNITWGTDGDNAYIGIENTGGYSNITIKNCRLYAGSSNLDTLSYGIRFTGSNNSFITNNTIITTGDGAGNRGIYTTSSENLTIKYNNIETNGTTANHGIYIEGGRNIFITNNTVLAKGTGAGGHGIFITTASRDDVIDFNYVRTEHPGATSYGIGISTNTKNMTITNNDIDVGLSETMTTSIGIIANGATANWTITNNLVTISSGTNNAPVQLNNADASTNGGTLYNNTLIGYGRGSSFMGIWVVNQQYANITKNIINVNGSTGARGLYGQTSSLNIYENNVVQTNGTGSGNYGLYFDTTNTNMTVRNNTIQTDGTISNYGLFFSSANFHDVRNNLIRADYAGSASYGIVLTNANGNQFYDNDVSQYYDSLLFAGTSANNVFVNNNFTSGSGKVISELNLVSGYPNYFIYNNSFGQIIWDGAFADNATLNMNDGSLGMYRNIFIGNNTIAVNASMFWNTSFTNSSVNITLFGINLTNIEQIRKVEYYDIDQGNITQSPLYSDCLATSACFNYSYDVATGTLLFNSSNFSSFTAFGGQVETNPDLNTTLSPVFILNTENNLVNKSQSFIFVNISLVGVGNASVVNFTFANSTTVNTTSYGYNLNSTLSFNWTFLYLGNDTYTYNVTVQNSKGINTSVTRTIFIDQRLPVLLFLPNTSSSGASTSNHQNIIINASILNEKNIANITFTIANSTTVNSTTYITTNNTFTFNYSQSFLGNGTWYYNFSVRDKANNLNTSETRSLIVDALPPVIPIPYNFTVKFVNPTPTDADTITVDNFIINVTLYTWNQTVGNCTLTFQGLNYTMTEVWKSVNETNCYTNKVSMGNAVYNFTVWGNTTLGLINLTETRTVTISVSNGTTPSGTGSVAVNRLHINFDESSSNTEFGSFGTFKQYQTVRLSQMCDNSTNKCSSCNISYVADPNSNVLVQDVIMTTGTADFYFNLQGANTPGTYKVAGYCRNGLHVPQYQSWYYSFEVSPVADSENNTLIFIIISLIGAILLAFALAYENYGFSFFSGLTISLAGVYSMINGFSSTVNVWTQMTSVIIIGLGMVITVVSAWEMSGISDVKQSEDED